MVRLLKVIDISVLSNLYVYIVYLLKIKNPKENNGMRLNAHTLVF